MIPSCDNVLHFTVRATLSLNPRDPLVQQAPNGLLVGKKLDRFGDHSKDLMEEPAPGRAKTITAAQALNGGEGGDFT